MVIAIPFLHKIFLDAMVMVIALAASIYPLQEKILHRELKFLDNVKQQGPEKERAILFFLEDDKKEAYNIMEEQTEKLKNELEVANKTNTTARTVKNRLANPGLPHRWNNHIVYSKKSSATNNGAKVSRILNVI